MLAFLFRIKDLHGQRFIQNSNDVRGGTVGEHSHHYREKLTVLFEEEAFRLDLFEYYCQNIRIIKN